MAKSKPSEERKGFVSLVGAGPGDPGLLTLAGAERLATAEVVVYDRLANPRLIDLAPPTAERIYVGKAADRHTLRQEEINALLVRKGLEGKRVVRLKGGDPYVFGRGGEEAEALVTAGVPFEVIPGVTSAVAAPAYAGIPVTHRGLASSVAFVTGHEDPGKDETAIDWPHLARGVDTIVFLMGTKTLPEIVERLVAGGRSPRTPVAVIEWGTLPRQRTVTGTLSDIVARVADAGLQPPALTVVGEVVGLRQTLRWFDTRPLFGQRVLVTRSRQQASALVRALEAAGAEAIEVPAIAVTARVDETLLAAALHRLRDAAYAWVVFTSANGVAFFFEQLKEAGLDARALGPAKVAAIGPGTAEALAAHGIRADLVPERFIAEGLVEAFARQELAGARVLLPRAEGARPELVDGLAQAGATVDEVTLYAAAVPEEGAAAGLARLRAGEVDWVTFASSSTVRNLVQMLGGDVEPLRRVCVACIGPVTARTVVDLLGKQPDVIASEHTIPGLVRAMIEHQQANSAVPSNLV